MKPIIVIHGGAGTIPDARKPIADEGVREAALAGWEVLEKGGTSLDAVELAVRVMEDLSNFNAGLGSVVTEEGTLEMDALIMDGKDLRVGGVIGVSRLKNPINVSRLILEKSNHVLFAGSGAEKFAKNNGVELINPESMITDRIRDRLARYLEKKEGDEMDPEGRKKYGTVGAVALDKHGNLAAATSTGGTLGKQIGRVGDTPIIGAGTYADEELAISSTGVGEYIIRGMLGMRVKLNMRDSKNMKEATKKSLEYLSKIGPSAVITLSKDGDWAAENTTDDLAFACKTEKELISFTDFEKNE